MPRVKGGVVTRRRHKKVLATTKGQRGNRHRLFRQAHEAMMHALDYAYAHRRERKGDMRRLWIIRINAAARLHGLTYGMLVHGLKLAGVDVNRKMLAELAVRDAASFGELAAVAKGSVA
ncbi:MAG: 50S ribosomal protein L20 [Chloroflexi bacterium]|nr:50S ribosomal protein L20 [Chloroflexota bacterium]